MTKKRILKFVKWFVGIIIALVLLITGCLYYFKDEIIGMVLEEVNAHLKAKVEVEKVDIAFWSSFPNLSVDFDRVFIRDTYKYASEKDTLFYSDKIRLRFNPLDIWREEYRLKRIDIYPGTLQLKVDDNGLTNYDILKETADTTETTVAFDLQKVNIDNLRFSYTNRQINHRYATDLIETELEGKFSEKVFTLHAKSSQIVRETRSGKINFVSNRAADLDINVEINQDKGTLQIPLTTILIEKLPFQFSGFLSPETMKFTIESKKLALTDVVKNFSLKEVQHVSNYSGTGTVNFLLVIEDDNRAKTNNLAVDCKFGVQNGSLIEPSKNIQINQLNLNGTFSNNKGKGGEYLALNNIRFNTKTGPFQGNLKVSEFNAPRFEGNANGNLNLETVHYLFPIPKIDKIGGNLMVNTIFHVKSLPAENRTNFDIIKCEGGIEFIDNYVQLLDDRRYFHAINGAIYLKNNDVGVNELTVKLGNSDLNLNGMFNNLIGYFKNDSKLIASMSVRSNTIRIEDLGTTSKAEQKQSNAPKAYVLPHLIDGRLKLLVGKLSYEGHEFEQIQGDLLLSDRTLSFSDIKFKTSGANVTGSVKIKEQSEEYFQTTSTLSSSNIQLKQLMKDWNNFTQDVIRSEHISGQAAAHLYLDAPFDLRTGVNFKHVKSELHLKIDNGRLKGVEAFNSMIESLKTPTAKLVLGAGNIKSFGDKLADLKFETLENTLIIKDGIITIPEMKINSSALNIETKGTHTFDNKIDYRFSFRLRDLKEKKTSEFGEIIDDNTGLIVYLRMYGTLDNPLFAWDKDSKSEDRKAYNEQEKQNLKSMLKTDFGMFKKDSTIQHYEEIKKPKEVLEVEYGNDTKQTESFEENKKKKDSKLNNFLNKMKEEEKTRKKVEVEFE
jgi:hypothetical protein